MPAAPLTVKVTLSAAQIAALVAGELASLPALAKARVMNRLFHEHPKVFAALLVRRPRENCGAVLQNEGHANE